jgi:hypothetical protein
MRPPTVLHVNQVRCELPPEAGQASLLNVLYLNRVFEWHEQNFSKSCFCDDIEIYVHHAFGIYGLESMPHTMVDRLRSIENYCQPWIQKLTMLGNTPTKLQTVRDTLAANDARRNLHLADVYPEVAELITAATSGK